MSIMPVSSITPKSFIHTALNTARNEIMVIRIKPGEDDTAIECEMKIIDLIADAYVCLSYLWGNKLATNTISIDGSVLTVGSNLHVFLKIARQRKIRDWLWIDAICISQGHDIERSSQVQLMGRIYQSALRTLVFLGLTQDQSVESCPEHVTPQNSQGLYVNWLSLNLPEKYTLHHMVRPMSHGPRSLNPLIGVECERYRRSYCPSNSG